MDKNSEAVAFGGCPAFLPEEIDLFLNQAYLEVVSNKFTGNNFTKAQFETTAKRVSDLQKLVKTDKAQNLVYPDSSSNVLILPNYFKDGLTDQRMFYVDCVLHFGDKSATCTLIDHDKAGKFLQTYNNTPWIDNPVVVIEDNKLKMFIDPISMVADSYTADITYVKYPDKISYKNYNSYIEEIPEHVVNEIVDRAVLIALETIESKRVGTKVQLDNMNE